MGFDLDGRTLETKTLVVQPNAPASVTFQPFTLARPFTRGTVRIGDDKLKQDNVFHFVMSPAQRLPVLILNPRKEKKSYIIHGRFAPGSRAASKTLPGFEVDVTAVFSQQP